MATVIAKQQSWHGPKSKHIEVRRGTVRTILDMLREKHPDDESKDRLPRIAKSLEYRLYLKAETLEEYLDEDTLKSRLRRIVRDVYVSAGKPLPVSCDGEPAPTLIKSDTGADSTQPTPTHTNSNAKVNLTGSVLTLGNDAASTGPDPKNYAQCGPTPPSKNYAEVNLTGPALTFVDDAGSAGPELKNDARSNATPPTPSLIKNCNGLRSAGTGVPVMH